MDYFQAQSMRLCCELGLINQNISEIFSNECLKATLYKSLMAQIAKSAN